MKNKITLAVLFVFMTITTFSQSISSSPYSIYGLGSLYDSDLGTIPSIGGSGLALPTNRFINNLNPASLAFMYQKHFLFEVGGKSIFTTYQDGANKESRNNVQFSHIALAFPVSLKSAVSVVLQPYSSATYKISNLKLPIIDSNEEYILNASGSGGLNNLDLSYGIKAGKHLGFGVTSTFLFGSITDNRAYNVSNSVTTINKTSSYNGVRLSVGSQIKVDSTFTIGIDVKSPSKVNATKVQSVKVVNSEVVNTVQPEANYVTDDYYLPVEIGIGVSKVFKNNLNFTLDYKKSLWNSTNQSDIYGKYTNQDKFGMGFSYNKPSAVRSYFDRITYSTGFNYDTGFLEIDSKKVNNMSVSVGVSLPIENTNSALNISYSYGQKGQISNGLIKENYHKISVNLCLDGIWFVKRKFE